MQQKKNSSVKEPDIEAWKRENSASKFIPYQFQLDEHTIKTKNNEYIQIAKLEGVAHESADYEDILLWKDQLNGLLRSLCSSEISIWSTIIRREKPLFPQGKFKGEFVDQLNQKYRAHVTKDRLMVNELYLSVLYRPAHAKKGGVLSSAFKSDSTEYHQKEDLEKMTELGQLVLSALEQFNPKLLSTYEKNGNLFSESVEFLDYLINAESSPRPLLKQDIATTLTRNRVFFGADTIEIRSLPDKRYAAILNIFEYPESTESGLLNAILSAPIDFILTQSFNFLSKSVALEILQRQQRRLAVTDDLAISQVAMINLALDDLASGRIVFGEHHFSLMVMADTPKELKSLVAQVRANLADCALITNREDWGLASAFWAQLPGNMKYRTRPSPISSKNFTGLSSFHNYPVGHIGGNQWGPAVTLFKTSSGAPYYFNFHEAIDSKKAREKALLEEKLGDAAPEDEGETQKALGNTLIIGPSGSGKTVVQGFLMAQSKKFMPTQVIFDKDRGLEIFVRANRGVYLPIITGSPTGFNPFQMDPNQSNILFLSSLIIKICGGVTVTEEKEIDNAVRGVMGLPQELRRIGRCLDFLDPVNSEGAHTKLSKWCGEGSLAWVLDNEVDNLDLENSDMFGFDVTEFLDNEEIRTPIIMYLFHRIDSLLDGRRFMMFLDEFWKLLLDDYFEDLAQNKQKVIRKQNGIMVYGTQSAKDVLKSPIAHTLIEQCATFIFMPNPKADAADYIDGFNLTEREFQLIRQELTPGSRQFLIKQGHNSVIAELNLKGFDDELSIISGTTENVFLLEKIIQQHGDDPAIWIDKFHEARKNN